MEVHIYSVKAKSQAGNICVKDIRKKAKAKRKSARDLKNVCFTIKFSRGPQVQEKALLGLHIYQREYTVYKLLQLYLVVQQKAQQSHK